MSRDEGSPDSPLFRDREVTWKWIGFVRKFTKFTIGLRERDSVLKFDIPI